MPSSNIRPFLEADDLTPEQLLLQLPYERARAGDKNREGPDAKRYRDGKQVYQTAGLLYEGDDGLVHVTSLGNATLRWLDILNPRNVVILGRHAAYALAACQLRNPTGAGKSYDSSVEVFPFSYIWNAMIKLDGKLSSDELNRGLFKVTNETELWMTIEQIAEARRTGDMNPLGDEVISGKRKNDRIIPWMSLASFGWTLFSEKRRGEDCGYYELVPSTYSIILEAARIRHRHREFASVKEYVEHIAQAAALPKDVR